MTFLDPAKFEIIAGTDTVLAIRAKRKPNTDIPAAQMQEARDGILGTMIVRSLYGWTVRYDSGLQSWAILARALPSKAEAAQFITNWVAVDPARRYGWCH